MLLGGLLTDIIQFTTFDIRLQFSIIGVYLLVAAASLVITVYPKALEIPRLRWWRLIAPLTYQFVIGNLLSASLLFYWFSGAFSVSWPIIILVAFLMLSNEFLRQHFLRPTVQVGVLAFALFSLAAIFFSFLFNSLEPIIFVEAGVASLILMLALVMILIHVGRLQDHRPAMLLTVVAIFGLLNAGYFLNVIPPIPLAIREAGFYHDLRRVDGEYLLSGEEESWLENLFPGQTVRLGPTDPLYAYTAIFAPVDLSTTIVHEWQFYDPSSNQWTTVSSLSFSVSGGRHEGYRGYSRKSHLTPGKWRVNVQTLRGQVLGRMTLTVVAP